jgi:hypothetical protein
MSIRKFRRRDYEAKGVDQLKHSAGRTAHYGLERGIPVPPLSVS